MTTELTSTSKLKSFMPKHKGSSALWWVLQRLTGVMLFVLILFHMLVNHYSSAHLPANIVADYGIASFQAVQWKMINFPLYSIISILFVLTVVFHMLNGFRTVMLDLAPGKMSKRILAMILLLIGILLVVYVAFVLNPTVMNT